MCTLAIHQHEQACHRTALHAYAALDNGDSEAVHPAAAIYRRQGFQFHHYSTVTQLLMDTQLNNINKQLGPKSFATASENAHYTNVMLVQYIDMI